MELKWKLATYDFVPANYDEDDTVPIFGLTRGIYVRYVAMRVGTLFNGVVAAEVGITTVDANGFMTTTDTAIGTAGLKNGTGALLTTDHSTSNGNGYLFVSATPDTIDLYYNYTSGTTAGVLTVYIIYAELE